MNVDTLDTKSSKQINCSDKQHVHLWKANAIYMRFEENCSIPANRPENISTRCGSFWGTLIFPNGEGFSKTSLLRKSIGRALGKWRNSKSWTKIYSNANLLLNMYITYVSLLLRESTRELQRKVCNSYDIARWQIPLGFAFINPPDFSFLLVNE